MQQLDATLRGAQAALAIGKFYTDPIACGRWMTRRFGSAVGVAPPFRGRRAQADAFFFSGAAPARAVYDQWDDLRPTGLWPVKAPKRTVHERLRFNFLCLSGDAHAHFSQQIAAPFGRVGVEAEMARQIEILRRETARLPADEPIDLSAATRRLATICVFDALFGERDAARAMRIGDLLQRYHDLNWSLAAMLLRLPIAGTPYAKVLAAAKGVREEVGAWLDDGAAAGSERDIRAALAAMRDAEGAPVSRDFAIANLCTIAWAAFDTPWLGLFWTLTFLARHRGVAADLQEELDGSGALDAPSVEKLARLPLLNGAILESLRLAPPAPFIGLRAVRDTSVGAVPIPNRAALFLSAYETHRDPDVYAEPERFRPERWSGAPNAYEFIAFSGGVRRCPGYNYSMMFLRAALATLLGERRVTLAEERPIPFRAAPTLAPTRAVPALLARRSRRATTSERALDSAFEEEMRRAARRSSAA